MLRFLVACVSFTVFATVPSLAETPAPAIAPMAVPTAPQVDARAYIVVDFRTDKILAAKDAVARVEPASLTKLMTAYIVFQELAAGKLKLDEQVTVSEHAWRSEGSRTFIELGKPVSVQDLILGMIVQSGNDATIALAERIAGTEATFAQMMNANAQRLKMVGSHFENSSGLPSPQHYTTARDLSLLANAMIREYPQYYKWFSVREFEHNGIKQQNRNGLLEKDPTVDGLKTGHTDSAGYCLVTSALRDGMRLVSVVMGSNSMKARENASTALLNYGFTFYDTKLAVKGGTVLASTRVWKGQKSSVDLGIKDDLYLTLPRGEAERIKTAADVQPRVIAPLALDSTLGSLRVFAGNQTLATLPLHPLKTVDAGGWWRRLIDTIRLWFT
ncbi:MAG TPA: D-alanyl-D-alanine carboxypeptidase family protein [Steroidobacteraceae bacterium]|nr:D-alanyl-D-alanine carboxypeptidase family protein [Steroidobacteraceae bacterium]